MRTDAAGDLTDTLQNRQVVNYWNRRRTPLYINPGYSDDNVVTTYTRNSATWTTMRATPAESQCTFIGNGEDAALFTINAMIDGAPTATVKFGIGLSTTQPLAIGSFSANAGNRPSSSCSYTWLPVAATLYTPQMLTVNSVNNATYVADTARDGAAADAPATMLVGTIFA
jgi:imidazolonepropionase-like amidohydrolase